MLSLLMATKYLFSPLNKAHLYNDFNDHSTYMWIEMSKINKYKTNAGRMERKTEKKILLRNCHIENSKVLFEFEF